MIHKHALFILTLTVSFILGACGFHPVYGVNKYTPVGAETKFSQIAIGNIPDREGQFLRNELIDNLHRSGASDNKIYELKITPIAEQLRYLDVTIDSDATRAQLTLSTTMTFTNSVASKTLLTRELKSTASFNILGSEFTNLVSEQSTRENVLKDLARQIELQLSLYFKRTQD